MHQRSNVHRLLASLAFAAFCLYGTYTSAAEDARPAAGIQDNSFLIEEAYNQEAGVVQHISTLRHQGHQWDFSFTQEWPVRSQTHQFSYTIPYSWVGSERAFGDVLLNYRYQALFEDAVTPAFAPRVSLILPTGDEQAGIGTGTTGYQINLPVSKIVAPRLTLHGNAGLTSYFDWHGHQPVSYNLGASAIYAVSRDFNLMLEALGEWTSEVDEHHQVQSDFTFTLAPGVRTAFNFPGDRQLVAGIAAPVSFTGSDVDAGIFLYLSFEHPFAR